MSSYVSQLLAEAGTARHGTLSKTRSTTSKIWNDHVVKRTVAVDLASLPSTIVLLAMAEPGHERHIETGKEIVLNHSSQCSSHRMRNVGKECSDAKPKGAINDASAL